MNLELQLGTLTATIGILFQKGVRFATVIDLGCADGTFYLEHFGIKDPFKDPARQSAMIELMEQRRRSLLERNASLLAQIRARTAQ